jgi:hypothetical protein
MKIVRQAGNTTIKLSKAEWQSIGKTAGWDEDWGGDETNEDMDEETPVSGDYDLDKLLNETVAPYQDKLKRGDEVGNKKSPTPNEVKEENRLMNQKDSADWEADTSERKTKENIDRARNTQNKEHKRRQKAVYDKDTIA